MSREELVTLFLCIIIIALAVWLRILSHQVTVLHKVCTDLCNITEKQAENMKKIVVAMQEDQAFTHDLMEGFISNMEQSTKSE